MNRQGRVIHSFSGLLTVIILILFITFLLTLSTYWYMGERNKVDSDFTSRQNMSEEMLRHSAIWIDRGIILYEQAYEPELRDAMALFQEAYQKAGSNLSSLSLLAIKDEFSRRFHGDWDVYVIEDGVVTHTTFLPDKDLDFTKYPALSRKYQEFTRTGEVVIDRTVKGFAPGAPSRKFIYQGTPDHQVLLEISRNFVNFHPDESKASYSELIRTTTHLNPYITSITLYNTQREAVAHFNRTEGERSAWLNIEKEVQETFSSRERRIIEDPSGQSVSVFTFIPVEDTGAPSTPMMHLVARITSSTEPLHAMVFQLTIWYVCFMVLTTLIAIILSLILSRHLTRPLTMIGDDIDQIASGNLDHPITPTGASETEKIELSLTRMVRNLKDMITTLRQREEDLSRELLMRRKAEERYRMLFESSHEAIFIIEGGIVRECNHEAARLLQRSRDEIVGRLLSSFSPVKETRITTKVGSEGFISKEWEFFRSDGALIETEVHLNTIQLDDTEIIQVMVRDVTELHEMYRRELQAIEQMEENLGQLAAVNDQIRNPLAIISSLTELSENEYHAEIEEQVDRINRMVDEIDLGFVATDKVRTYLRKYYEIEE